MILNLFWQSVNSHLLFIPRGARQDSPSSPRSLFIMGVHVSTLANDRFRVRRHVWSVLFSAPPVLSGIKNLVVWETKEAVFAALK